VAVLVRSLFDGKFAENAQTTQYTSSAVKTIVDKFTVTNATGSAATFALNLVPSGGAAGTSNLLISRTIQPAETYLCPEVVGHILDAGDFLSTLAGTATALSIQASGRTVT
jgi:hypothetical protein